jgi:hypothetical protein
VIYSVVNPDGVSTEIYDCIIERQGQGWRAVRLRGVAVIE